MNRLYALFVLIPLALALSGCSHAPLFEGCEPVPGVLKDGKPVYRGCLESKLKQ